VLSVWRAAAIVCLFLTGRMECSWAGGLEEEPGVAPQISFDTVGGDASSITKLRRRRRLRRQRHLNYRKVEQSAQGALRWGLTIASPFRSTSTRGDQNVGAALEVATRVDRRQCVAQVAGGCSGPEVGMQKASIPHDALVLVGDGTRAVFFRNRGTMTWRSRPSCGRRTRRRASRALTAPAVSIHVWAHGAAP
jgi:hypothetical protein